MKIKDLPEDAQLLCDRYKNSIGTRLVLMRLTGKICPEFQYKKDIEAFLETCDQIVPQEQPRKPAQAGRPTPQLATTNDGRPSLPVIVDAERICYGSCSYSEREYANNTTVNVPAEVILEGEGAIRDWILENVYDLFEDSGFDDVDYDNYNRSGIENEDIVIASDIDVLTQEAESLLGEENNG